MLRGKRSIESLCAVFRGIMPDEEDWQELLLLANRAWIAPAIHVTLAGSGKLAELPSAVRDYLAFLHECNLRRNGMLRAQLIEAAAAFNQRDLVPIILKGGIQLVDGPPEMLGFRMISDIDLSFAPSDIAAAREALAAIGYAPTRRSNEMARAQDAGTIELHGRPNGRSAAYLSGDLASSSSMLEVEGARVLVPSPNARALHIIVHDMMKEGDYWRLRIDLRHLLDLHRLAQTPEFHWGEMAALLADDRGRRALEVEAVALHRLFAVPVPPHLLARRARGRHAATLVASGGGPLGAVGKTVGNLSWGVHRLVNSRNLGGPMEMLSRVRRTFTEGSTGSRL